MIIDKAKIMEEIRGYNNVVSVHEEGDTVVITVVEMREILAGYPFKVRYQVEKKKDKGVTMLSGGAGTDNI